MNLLETASKWKRAFLILSMIPIILIGIVYIVYGSIFNSLIVENTTLLDFFKLSNQLTLFSSELSLPIIVKSLCNFSIITLYIIFILWLCLHTIINYLKLSQHTGCKIDLIIELLIIAILYFLIISPISIISYLLGCIILIINLALIVIYWIYQIKDSNEKR